jgi:hypothetical protein
MHGHTVSQARRDAPRNPCFTIAGGLIMTMQGAWPCMAIPFRRRGAMHRATPASLLPEH